MKVLATTFDADHPGISFVVPAGTNSGGAITGVADGTLDLGVVNRAPTAEQRSPPVR